MKTHESKELVRPKDRTEVSGEPVLPINHSYLISDRWWQAWREATFPFTPRLETPSSNKQLETIGLTPSRPSSRPISSHPAVAWDAWVTLPGSRSCLTPLARSLLSPSSHPARTVGLAGWILPGLFSDASPVPRRPRALCSHSITLWTNEKKINQ